MHTLFIICAYFVHTLCIAKTIVDEMHKYHAIAASPRATSTRTDKVQVSPSEFVLLPLLPRPHSSRKQGIGSPVLDTT